VDSLLASLTSSQQDSDTKSWILNALAKITSVSPGNNTPEVQQAFEYYSSSKYFDLCQRAAEYKYLSKYRWGLTMSQELEVNGSLPFLDYYVGKALQAGAKARDPNRKIDYLIESMNTSSTSKLNFEAYPRKTPQVAKQALDAAPGETETKSSEDLGLKLTGPKKWSSKGYDDPKEKEVVASSTSTIKGEDYKGIGVSGNRSVTDHYRNNLRDQLEKRNFELGLGNQDPKPKTAQVTNPLSKEKQQLANNLFAGISTTSNRFSNLTAPIEKVWGKEGYNRQVDERKKNYYQVVDLLQEEVSEVAFSRGGVKITLQEYEQNWDKLPLEIVENFQGTKIKNQDQFQNMINNVGLEVIEIAGNEVISAGKTTKNELVLVYGSFDASGNLEMKSKTRRQNESDFFMKKVREFAF
jgi:hypothetical protein